MADDVVIPVDSMRFTALTDGPADGELVPFLHGFPESAGSGRTSSRPSPAPATTPSPTTSAATRRAPGRQPSTDYAIHLLVDDALGMATALGAARFHLVGHDWGAIVAWHVAARAPERLRSLTVVPVPHPSAFAAALADPASGQPEKSAYFDMLRAPEVADGFVKDGDGSGLRATFDAAGLAGHDVDRHVAVLTDTGAMDAACNWYRAYDFHHASLPDIDVPTLFVWSDDDVAVARAGADLTGRHVTGSYRYEVLEGISHWIPEVAADRFTGLLLEHLQSV